MCHSAVSCTCVCVCVCIAYVQLLNLTFIIGSAKCKYMVSRITLYEVVSSFSIVSGEQTKGHGFKQGSLSSLQAS